MNEKEVRILKMDPEKSKPSGEGALVDVHLEMSNQPPYWGHVFESIWASKTYSMKRKVTLTGNSLMIRCMPEEVSKVHLPALKEAVAQANLQWAKEEAVRVEDARRRREENARKEKELKGIADDINASLEGE